MRVRGVWGWCGLCSKWARLVETPVFRRLAEVGMKRRAREMFVEEYERFLSDMGPCAA